MGTSTDAIICFGYDLEEGINLPWGDHDSIGNWWSYVNGFKPDTDGDNIYFQRRDFLKNYPMPVELVKHCSSNYPMYILAVPGTVKRATRGCPLRIGVNDLSEVKPHDLSSLAKFIGDYEIKVDDYPGWYMVSYWW